jgi:hypothetical protein
MKFANFVPSEERESDAISKVQGDGRSGAMCVEKVRSSIPQFDLTSVITVGNRSYFLFLLKLLEALRDLQKLRLAQSNHGCSRF